MALLQRAKDSGCPPSLLTENRLSANDGFEDAVTKFLNITTKDLQLTPVGNVTEDFQKAMKMAELDESHPTSKDSLELRRCILLSVVGSTPVESETLKSVLESGFLVEVKKWYDQILNGSSGGVDLLLHLLSSIKDLPVTKSLVKQSGMGKAIGSIEKHSICAGTPNEAAITERVQQIKNAWNASVKARKEKDGKADNKSPPPKRQISGLDLTPSPSAKKQKVEEKKKPNSFSSLLKKVSDSSPGKGTSTGSANKSPGSATKAGSADAQKKKSAKRVKWADHFGGNLTASKLLDSSEAPAAESAKTEDAGVSWTDRKKRDRLKEKELLAKAKRAKLMDDDDDIEPVRRMAPTREWRQPSLIPDNPEVTKPQLNSTEIAVQVDRMTKVHPARYVSDDSVPNSPTPLSDVEQALDMTSVASAVVAAIPFFVPQASAPAPVVAPAPAPATSYVQPPVNAVPAPPSAPPAPAYAPPAQSAHEAATAQTVQALGLPMFLVGSNVHALNTLASSPSLLSTLVEPNGMYDQPRLMNLVQTLSQNIPPSQPRSPGGPSRSQIPGSIPGYQPPAPAAPPSYNSQPYSQPGGGIYGPASTAGTNSSYGPASTSTMGGGFGGSSRGSGGYRGESNSDGNLHVSGYGPTTTQTDIIALFSQYVKVDEVVMKHTFSFVNTSDPIGAKQAREALSGALLGGMPIRINMAQRRSRDPNYSANSGGRAAPPPPPQPMQQRNNMPPFPPRTVPPPPGPPGLPGAGGLIDDVRDDRGNPATKNLFVAGYGPGTNEMQLRDVFGQYATIVGVITKGSFSFVNTSDKGAAIRARESLSGTMLNGGVLRINFAKETGRLGTSFDLTYGPGSGGGGGGGGGHGHYGRSY